MKLPWTVKIEESLRRSIKKDIESGKIKNYEDLIEKMWDVAERATEFTHNSKFIKRMRNVKSLYCFIHYRKYFVEFVSSDMCKGELQHKKCSNNEEDLIFNDKTLFLSFMS